MKKIFTLILFSIILFSSGCTWKEFKDDSNNGFESTKKSVNKLFE